MMVGWRIRHFLCLALVLVGVNAEADRCDSVPEVFATMPKNIVEIWNEDGSHSVIRVRMAVSARKRAAGFHNECEAAIARLAVLL